MTDQKVPSLFNYHEIWGMTIASIYFLIGFPSNLLSIVVCCRSLFQKYFAKITKNRRSKLFNKEFKSSFIYTKAPSLNVSGNTHQNDILINTYETKGEMNQNLVFDDSYTKISKARDRNSLKKIKSNELLSKNSSILNLKESQLSKLKAKTNSKNPHCKSFELYLVEISFCDIIIITYNFVEWTLLVLSRFNLIDHIYAEPVLISKFMCRFIISLNRTVILVHNWLVAFMAITRCYAIYKPLNSNTYFGSKFYFKLNISVLLSLIFIFTTFNVYGVSFLSYNKTPFALNSSNITSLKYNIECKVPQEIYTKYKYFDAYVNLTLGIIGYSLPCFITLIINLILIYNIRNLNPCYKGSGAGRRSVDRFGMINNQFSHTTRNKNQFFKATSSLLTLSFSYLICNIPYSFLFLLMSLNMVKMNGDVIFALTCLRYLNHILNFYIYFATGKRFRNDVIRIFRLKK
ncbi:unnamed protein product [Brachionus calyciflorus]|uniref:G-protein coupled receptors family 1 profile domain-containing protein n=1 Tax=Brachionus calyciflorus TaxID=104777 RepID=A0A813M3I7_9BILA|nr:unnamed protein product [Brachionus calyciflorus]